MRISEDTSFRARKLKIMYSMWRFRAMWGNGCKELGWSVNKPELYWKVTNAVRVKTKISKDINFRMRKLNIMCLMWCFRAMSGNGCKELGWSVNKPRFFWKVTNAVKVRWGFKKSENVKKKPGNCTGWGELEQMIKWEQRWTCWEWWDKSGNGGKNSNKTDRNRLEWMQNSEEMQCEGMDVKS